MSYEVNLMPAYRRDYKTAKEVLKDWRDGIDFEISDIGSPWNGKLTSRRDWRGKGVRIRYNRLASFVITKG